MNPIAEILSDMREQLYEIYHLNHNYYKDLEKSIYYMELVIEKINEHQAIYEGKIDNL